MQEEFEQFWKSYPRKIAKGDARKAWKQTEKIRPPLSHLMKALAVAKASDQWRKDGGSFIPYPSTWLRGERWDDVMEIELAQVRADGRMWWETNHGIEAKAKEMGQEWDAKTETWLMFVERLKRLAKVVPIQEARQVTA